MEKEYTATLLVRLARLGAAVGALFLIVRVLAPLPLEHIAAFGAYARVVNETGINPGALYYTDVPQSSIGEMHNRDTLRYFLGTAEPRSRR